MIKARAAGDAGLLLDTDVPPAWLAAAIEQAALPGVVDVIPGAATVLVLTRPGTADFAELAASVAALPVTEPATSVAAVIEIPVRYDGADLADVAELTGLSVAEVIAAHSEGLYTVGWLGFSPGFGYLRGLDHRLGGVPRLATPRPAVPAGSVAIAAGLAAVYPRVSPGGWRLLGHTTIRMWDEDRDPAALLTPGRHVRFVAIAQRHTSRSPVPGAADTPVGPGGAEAPGGQGGGEAPDRSGAAKVAGRPGGGEAPGRSGATVAAAAVDGLSLEVIKPGPLATVQDLGRCGQGSIGVPPSGAADPASLIAANRLVGNPDSSAGVELTLGRAAFRSHGDLVVAVTGAPATVTVTSDQPTDTEPSAGAVPRADTEPSAGAVPRADTEPTAGAQPLAKTEPSTGAEPEPVPARVPTGFGMRVEAAAGSVISIGAPSTGLRCYVAVAGGVAVPAVLGSRSADLLSHLGGGPLKPGAMLPIGSDGALAGDMASRELAVTVPVAAAFDVSRTATLAIKRGCVAELRVIGGPRLDWFEADALDRLCSSVYTVTPASNRTGLRLDGEQLRRSSDAELSSEGLVTGALQVPPDGLPILLLADHPTVGGYPVIVCVTSTDIGVAAQLRPGDRLRFTRSVATR